MLFYTSFSFTLSPSLSKNLYGFRRILTFYQFLYASRDTNISCLLSTPSFTSFLQDFDCPFFLYSTRLQAVTLHYPSVWISYFLRSHTTVIIFPRHVFLCNQMCLSCIILLIENSYLKEIRQRGQACCVCPSSYSQ